MPSCVVKWCKNNSCAQNKHCGITFHKFPRKTVWKEIWIKAIRDSRNEEDWLPSKSSVVCSIHFEECDIYYTKCGLRRIKKNAKPTKVVNLRGSEPDFDPEHSASDFNTELEHYYIKLADQTQTKPFKQNPTPGDENDEEQDDDDDAIYERDVSPIRTDDEAEVRVPEGSSRRHEGCRCDVCRGTITGFRYACVECANFDLCAACEARGHHATHYVLRVPAGKLNSDVQAVIKKIREDLLKVDKPEEGIIEEHSIKIEMKEEDLKQEDPLEETAELSIEPLQDAGSQNDQCKESEDSVAAKFLTLSERGEEPFTEVPLTHQSKLLSQEPQVVSQQPAMSLALSHRPQVLSHKPAVPAHQLTVLSHQPRAQSKGKSYVKPKALQVLSHRLRVLSPQPAVPQVLSHQPAVLQVSSQKPHALSHELQVPHMTTQDKRYLMIEVQGAGMTGTAGTASAGDAVGTAGMAGAGVAGGSYAVYTHHAHPAPISQHEGEQSGEPTCAALASAGDASSTPARKKRKK